MLEGLTAQLLFNPSNSDIIQQYIRLNPSLNHVTWQNMQIKDAVVYASTKDATGEAESTYRAIIDATIPGMKFQNVKNFDTTLPPPSLTEEVSSEKTVFGSSSGIVRLNLLGACKYFDDVNKPIPGKDINDISDNLILRANYTFQLKAHRSFTATYNLFNMFSRIEKASSSRGWFSTASVHSIIEDNKSEDWFRIKFDGNAAEFGYTPQEQKEIEIDEKTLLVDRALRQFAMINAGSTPPGLMPPPVSGIMYASNRLNLCNHFYCQVGSFVLGTIGSLFGGSNAASEFQKKTNVWSKDSVSGYQIIDRTNQITFISK
ncbi:hypothetical protein QEJ31_02220 [Pigmentibacter sp. JX0631]|uniref:hypothetical protein n=1 Tax=Pigmentibacter sp. JX0631 TaxID=2976982 RepID=UPI00246863E4|nr:hypothetical protein [Pigmentibacter sp. JX0631]WGL60420.1 hypothetical protein QEJ31_02220 [Pigmentibacter sp. JX0631]